jgi:hypothetical protein
MKYGQKQGIQSHHHLNHRRHHLTFSLFWLRLHLRQEECFVDELIASDIVPFCPRKMKRWRAIRPILMTVVPVAPATIPASSFPKMMPISNAFSRVAKRGPDG